MRTGIWISNLKTTNKISNLIYFTYKYIRNDKNSQSLMIIRYLLMFFVVHG